MKKVVISGYYGFDNAGDEALLAAIIKDLQGLAPDIEITVLSGNPEKTAKLYKVAAISRTNLWEMIKALKKADLLISGGGSLLQDITGPLSIPYYLGVVQLGKLLGVPVMFYAQGVGPVNEGFGKHLIKEICNKVDLITLRDEKSKKTLIQLGVNRPPMKVTADPVLGFQPERICTRKDLAKWGLEVSKDLPLIGFSIRDWKGLKNYKEILAKSADYIKAKGWEVLFVPMHYPEDLATSQEIAQLMVKPPLVLDENLNWLEYFSVIQTLDILVGMRLHALIFASVSRVPVLGISYDPKVDHYLDLVDQPNIGPVEELKLDEVIEHIERIMTDREEVSRKLNESMLTLRNKAKENPQLAWELLTRA